MRGRRRSPPGVQAELTDACWLTISDRHTGRVLSCRRGREPGSAERRGAVVIGFASDEETRRRLAPVREGRNLPACRLPAATALRASRAGAQISPVVDPNEGVTVPPLVKLLLIRLGLGLLTLFLVTVIVFAATQALPGDAAKAVLGEIPPTSHGIRRCAQSLVSTVRPSCSTAAGWVRLHDSIWGTRSSTGVPKSRLSCTTAS